jgi:hypothetical protein
MTNQIKGRESASLRGYPLFRLQPRFPAVGVDFKLFSHRHRETLARWLSMWIDYILVKPWHPYTDMECPSDLAVNMKKPLKWVVRTHFRGLYAWITA